MCGVHIMLFSVSFTGHQFKILIGVFESQDNSDIHSLLPSLFPSWNSTPLH